MCKNYFLRTLVVTMLVLLNNTISFAGSIPGLPNSSPGAASAPILSSGTSSWGNDIVVSTAGDDQTSNDVYVTSFGWIYVSMATLSPSGGGIRIAVSKDNGVSFSTIYDDNFSGIYYSSLRIVVPGYDSTSAKIFMSGILTSTATGEHNPFVVQFNAISGSFESTITAITASTDSIYDCTLITDFLNPAYGSSPYGLAMAYSRFGAPQDSIFIITSVDGGVSFGTPVGVAGTSRYFGKISLAYGHGVNWSNGRLFLAAHEHAYLAENGNVRVFRTQDYFYDNAIVDLGYIDSLDTYTNGHTRNPSIMVQNTNTDNDSNSLSAVVIFECDINGDGSDIDFNGFTCYEPMYTNHWVKTFADVTFNNTIQPHLNWDPAYNNFLLTYEDVTIGALFYKYTGFNFGSGAAVWNPVNSQYNDIPSPNGGAVVSAWPRVAIDPLNNQAVFCWMNQGSGGNTVLFDAEFSSVNVPLVPSGITALESYPNPVNTSLTVTFNLHTEEVLTAGIYDLTGQLLISQNLSSVSAGRHVIQFDLSELASGVYSYRIMSKTGMETRSFVVSH